MRTILCYGDSNLRGFIPGSFDPKKGLSKRFSRDQRWTGILQKKLGDSFYLIEEGLNGRTTNVDEIVPGRPYRNALAHLPMMLESHFPVDLVIFWLGTNDLKVQFGRSSREIAEGMRELVSMVKSCDKGPDGKPPKVLMIAPPPLLETPNLAEMFCDETCKQKSREIPGLYQQVAAKMGCEFLDASLIAKFSDKDGVHLDERAGEIVADAMASKIIRIF